MPKLNVNLRKKNFKKREMIFDQILHTSLEDSTKKYNVLKKPGIQNSLNNLERECLQNLDTRIEMVSGL